MLLPPAKAFLIDKMTTPHAARSVFTEVTRKRIPGLTTSSRSSS